mmetsp:Transcript_55117/g.98364  ORF Transcript_55117/g.98364 Transcript_55117/m.98364 type:complete len:1247 (-) Transcript_55117:167-3907(-)|eukprot:CAMPEP_0197658614 /NCGR_PEP_ID=MMETSP1338-20131121/45334_1 /TAXON_ID=43686 ORGANISM="Pelagodinium beii, Strain RCC1491" /NCGR_SAMPLE_ID=MMETSP1338 /ASSEMBLY_ACC=CAM_ASM_000754 /LENGTH=1246 /DNA_ID=CAMNT_0043235227 /DNA_START=88 /DNA_END=3828 /DNA_ORIENTATION=+
MGIILAKREEDRLQYNQTRARAAVYLDKCKPDYIEDENLLGLAPQEEDPDQEDSEEEEEGEQEEEEKEEKEDDEDGEEDEEAEEEQDPAKKAKERVKAELKKLRHAAITGNRWKLLKMTRSPHLAIDTPDKHGRTALYLAVEAGQSKAVEILLNARARHDSKTKDGWTPLHAAAFHGQVFCIHMLLAAQADVNAKEKHGCTPLMMAASSPKLYLVDLVSRADRRIRSRVRQDAMKKLREEENGMDADMLSRLKEKMDTGSSTQQTAPNLVWKFYPNRIEIIVLNALLEATKVKVDAFDNKRRTAILYAARYGRTYAVSRLLDAKASLAFADREGQVALFAAACNEHHETVDILLRAGATINATDQYFRTPLHGALEIGDESMANLLLKADASVNAYDCEGRTPIMLAMDQANRRLFKKIVEKKSNLDVLDKRGWNVVIYAIETGMLSDVYPLLVKLQKNASIILRARDPQGCNSIHHAAQLDVATASAKSVEMLMTLDVEAATIGDCNGDTAIHSAAERGRLEVLRKFLEKMPVADFLNNRGETPLHYAARGGHMACVVALLHDGPGKQSSCDSGAIDSAGWNLLMHACVSGHLDLVNLMLQNREGQHPDLAFSPLDVNHSDASGVNALSVAAREGHWQLLPSLVIAGLNTAAKDRDGFTATHWAAMEDEPLTMKCLLDLNCDSNVQDAKGWTPLMHACARGADEVVRVLVDDRADINARNWDGDTALQITMRRRDPADVVAVTKDILIDGIMASDEPVQGGSINALGHMMVSVLEATDLYLEGKTGFVNTYVNLQLRMQSGARPQAAFTSCMLQNSSPEWHEVFRFDTTRMDPSACLVAWVVAAPGESAKEVMDGAAMGLDEEELAALSHMEALTGKTLNSKEPQFTSSMQDSFKRLMKRSDKAEDAEVLRLRKLAMAQLTSTEPTQDLKFSQEQIKGNDGLSVADRRWNEVRNLREVLAASGCDVPEPLVPRTHLPLGCVVIRYRHLRAAVWGNEPVTVVRTLRLSCRGSLRVQIDFRPKFFECKEEERAKMLSQEEEDEIYGLLPVGEEDEWKELLLTEEASKRDAESRSALKDLMAKQKAKAAAFNAEEAVASAARNKHMKDPEALMKRFRQVTRWTGIVLRIKDDYRAAEARRALDMKKPLKKSLKDDANAAAKKREGPKLTKKAADWARGKYKTWSEERARKQAALDKPIGTAPQAEDTVTKEVKPGITVAIQKKLPVPTIPKLKTERWVEEFLETSRLI